VVILIEVVDELIGSMDTEITNWRGYPIEIADKQVSGTEKRPENKADISEFIGFPENQKPELHVLAIIRLTFLSFASTYPLLYWWSQDGVEVERKSSYMHDGAARVGTNRPFTRIGSIAKREVAVTCR